MQVRTRPSGGFVDSMGKTWYNSISTCVTALSGVPMSSTLVSCLSRSGIASISRSSRSSIRFIRLFMSTM
jgi:hypothetical protein